MIHIPVWKRVLVVFVVALSFIYCVPSFLNAAQRDSLKKNMPSWFPTQTISLGLDLQGGSYMLLEADIPSVVKQNIEDAITSIRTELAKDKIMTKSLTATTDGLSLELTSAADVAAARKIIREANTAFTLADDGAVVTAKFDEKALKTIQDQTMAQSIEIVSRRVNESGTKEPIIQRQGENRILVQLPGINDPNRLVQVVAVAAIVLTSLFNITGIALHRRKKISCCLFKKIFKVNI